MQTGPRRFPCKWVQEAVLLVPAKCLELVDRRVGFSRSLAQITDERKWDYVVNHFETSHALKGDFISARTTSKERKVAENEL